MYNVFVMKKIIAIVICLIIGTKFTYSQISKRLQKIVRKIEKERNLNYLTQALNLIKNSKNIKKKFKIWKFFLKNFKTNKFAKETLKNYIWQDINEYITTLFHNELEKYRLCSIKQYPRFHYAYIPEQNILYLGSPNNRLNPLNDYASCKNNVKIVDGIYYLVMSSNNTFKSITFAENNKFFVILDSKKLLGPYKNVSLIRYDKEFKKYAFTSNDGKYLHFNGKEIELKYRCPNTIGVYGDNVFLACKSKKYKNSQFILRNLKEKFAICKGEIDITISDDGNEFAYVCHTTSITSIYYKGHPIKRYKRDGAIISNLTINKKYVSFLILNLKQINLSFTSIIHDIINNKTYPIKSINSNIIFIGKNYYYLKIKGENIYLYKNRRIIYRRNLSKIFIQHNLKSHHNPRQRLYYHININNLAKKGFYWYMYYTAETISREMRHLFFTFWNGKLNIWVVRPSLQSVVHINDNETIIDLHDGQQPVCLLYTKHGVIKKNEWQCHYSPTSKILAFLKYLKNSDTTIIYINQQKKKLELKGKWGWESMSGDFLKIDKYFLYIPYNKEESLPSLLFIPLIKNKVITISTNKYIILKGYNTSSFINWPDEKVNTIELYLLNHIPEKITNEINKIKKFCTYQKKLCDFEQK